MIFWFFQKQLHIVYFLIFLCVWCLFIYIFHSTKKKLFRQKNCSNNNKTENFPQCNFLTFYFLKHEFVFFVGSIIITFFSFSSKIQKIILKKIIFLKKIKTLKHIILLVDGNTFDVFLILPAACFLLLKIFSKWRFVWWDWIPVRQFFRNKRLLTDNMIIISSDN